MSIRFESVTKSFGERTILKDVSFEVGKGEIVFILGKSGVGKSVTLKHIIGLLKPDRGTVWVDQANVSDATSEELPEIRLLCGMVFQHPALLDSLSIFENVAFGLQTPQFKRHQLKLHQTQLSAKQIRETVLKKLALVHLTDESILEKRPPEISYGMQKRVSMARTLAPQPQYLLFDEPTTGLDPITTTAVNEQIQELSKTLGVTSIVVSHDMRCALEIADRILVLDQGRVLVFETPEQIKKNQDPLIRDFLSEIVGL